MTYTTDRKEMLDAWLEIADLREQRLDEAGAREAWKSFYMMRYLNRSIVSPFASEAEEMSFERWMVAERDIAAKAAKAGFE